MSYKIIAITTGDRTGIGFEVSAKALNLVSPSLKKNKSLFFLFRHKSQEKLQPQLFKLIDKTWARLTFNSFEDAIFFVRKSKKNLPDNALIDLSLSTPEALWVKIAAIACGAGLINSLVTGPLSKKLSVRLPRKPIGHTGIFRQLYPQRSLFMAFVGKSFNVVLATDHISLRNVEKSLTPALVKKSISAGLSLAKILRSKKPVALLGLNPHSGEGGLIGGFEKKTLRRLPKNVVGPVVPDAAFLKKNWSQYSCYVCLYHDQGLTPFKMQHGQDSGVHLTLGLPFVRTSVDHGTATDLFNKNLANPSSMYEALLFNLRLIGD